VAILDDELIVVRPNTWLGRWAIAYAELDGASMPDGVKSQQEQWQDRRGGGHAAAQGEEKVERS
jgi:hypothetical protein